MGLKFSNFGKAVISTAPTGTSGLGFSVEAGKGLLFPALASGDYFYGIFKDASGNREIVKVEGRSTDAMTIAAGGRGLDGTTPRTWAAGDYFVAGITNIALQETISNQTVMALGALLPSADKIPYFTGSDTAALTTLTSFARSLLDDADATAMKATLGIVAAAVIIPAGTSMLFYQATAPTGWTHDGTALNHALRVVGGGSSGGSASSGGLSFSSAFASRALTGAVANHTLTESQIPAHAHSITTYDPETGSTGVTVGGPYFHSTQWTNITGGGGAHNHGWSGSLNMAVNYLNVIRATKN